MVPSQIDLVDGLYLDGFLYENILANNDYLTMRLKTQLRYDNATFDSSNCANSMHVKIGDESFAIETAVNDCTVNELLFTLYEAGLLQIPLVNERIDTSLISLMIGHNVVKVFG